MTDEYTARLSGFDTEDPEDWKELEKLKNWNLMFLKEGIEEG